MHRARASTLHSCQAVLSLAVVGALAACGGGAKPEPGTSAMKAGPVRIAYLHHSTGEIVWAGGLRPRLHALWQRYVPGAARRVVRPLWEGGVPEVLEAWNAEHGTDYRVTRYVYPHTKSGYPWANYPYDYWNLWVRHTGASRDRGEPNLDDLVRDHDIIVFKHCYPVSNVVADDGAPSVSSDRQTIANYQLQYQALKERLHQFPDKRFIVWTGPALVRADTNPDEARRAREFFRWVKESWDEPGDNIFVWDFRVLEADAEGFLDPAYQVDPRNSHPNARLARMAAPLLARRIIDVIEGRGDTGSLTGRTGDAPAARPARASAR